MNLPSLRREHAVGTEVPATSPSISHTWGSSNSSSPSNSYAQPSELEHKLKEVTKETESVAEEPPQTSDSATVRAWAVPDPTPKSTVQTTPTDFPTAAEASTNNTSKSFLC